MIRTIFAFTLSCAAIISGCNSGEAICYVQSQSELDQRIADPACSFLALHGATEAEISAATERDLVGFSFSSCPNLRRVVLDHVAYAGPVGLESLEIRNFAGGAPIASQELDIEVGADVAEEFRILQWVAGDVVGEPHTTHVRLRAAGSMDGWTVRPHAQTSWRDVTLEIDPSALPTGTLSFGATPGNADLRLDQMQAFGALAARVEITDVLPEETRTAYKTWLESEGFAGQLVLLSDDQTEVVLLPGG